MWRYARRLAAHLRALPVSAPSDISTLGLVTPYLAVTISVVVATAWHGLPMGSPPDAFWYLLVATIAAETAEIRFGSHYSAVLSPPFMAIALTVLSPSEDVEFMVAAGSVVALVNARSWVHAFARFSCFTSQMAFGIATVMLLHRVDHASTAGFTLTAVVVLLAFKVWDYTVFPIGTHFGERLSPNVVERASSGSWFSAAFIEPYNRDNVRIELVALCVELPFVLVAAVSIGAAPWSAMLLALPIVVAAVIFRANAMLTERISDANRRLAHANLQFAAAMVHALDARDSYTAGHSAAVATYARDIGLELGFDPETCRRLHLAGLLHDIGKIGVPGNVLNKRGSLTDMEFEMMKEHANIGAEIVAEVDEYSDLVEVIRYHHERYDGRGYPTGIAGDDIPILSRILTVADTYSAMTTDRPYRQGLDPVRAIQEIVRGRGSQFDARFADAFLRILDREGDEYLRGRLAAFEIEVAKHRGFSDHAELRDAA